MEIDERALLAARDYMSGLPESHDEDIIRGAIEAYEAAKATQQPIMEGAGCELARTKKSSCENSLTMPVGSNPRTTQQPDDCRHGFEEWHLIEYGIKPDMTAPPPTIPGSIYTRWKSWNVAWHRSHPKRESVELDVKNDRVCIGGKWYVPSGTEKDPVRKWQPIETAPKDGTRVLLYVEQHYFGKTTHSSFFITDAYCDDEDDWITKWGNDTVESIAYNVENFKVNPTHWMPLPEIPRRGTDE